MQRTTCLACLAAVCSGRQLQQDRQHTMVPESFSHDSHRQQREALVWAFGDSLTAGLHSCTLGAPLESCAFSPYAPHLQDELRRAGHTTALVRHKGYPGWTSQELLTKPNGTFAQPGLSQLLQREGRATLAVIMAGSHDLGRRETASAEDVAHDVWALHGVAHGQRVPTVLVAIPPGSHRDPTGIPPAGLGMGVRDSHAYEQARRQVNARLRERCAAAGALCTFAECPVEWVGRADTRWETDAVHLSASGYEALGRGIAPTVSEALTRAQSRAAELEQMKKDEL